MNFNDPSLYFFIGLALIILKFIHSTKKRKIVLLVTSYLFYASWEPWFLIILIFTTLIDFICGKKIYESQQKGRTGKEYLQISLALNLGCLIFFRYILPWGLDNLVSLELSTSYREMFNNAIVPVGISYYTFQTLSYTIDIYRKRIQPESSILDYGVYVSFFPQLLGGPIERAEHFIPQINKGRSPSDWNKGIWLISYGLFLKFFCYDNFKVFLDHFYKNYQGEGLLVPVFMYFISVTIVFCDFGGYSKIARGIGYLFGFSLMKNFGPAMFSRNMKEFWSHWHISLTTWLRDYFYLFMKEKGFGYYISSILLFLVIGLWHEISLKFLIVGIHFACITMFSTFLHRRGVNLYPKNIILRGITILFVSNSLGYVFSAPDIPTVLSTLAEIGNGFQASRLVGLGCLYFLVFMVPVYIIEYFSFRYEDEFHIINRKFTGILVGIMWIVLMFFTPEESDIFIYLLF